MKVIPPLTITDAIFGTSTAAEPGTGETAWASGGTYPLADRRIRATTHRIYECVLAHTGVTALPENDATHWLDVGPTNAWAMFDLERSSQTVVTGGNLVVTLAPGKRINSLGLVGLQASQVTVQMHEGATQIYTKTQSLLTRNTTTWTQYFFGEFRPRRAFVTFDLPLSSTATLTITLTPNDGAAKCGGLVIGMVEDLGTIVDEPTSDVNNFSRVTRDEFGTATLTKRRNVPLLSHRVRADAARLDRLRELRETLDATPALWSGVDDRQTSPFFDTMLLLGLAKKWSIGMPSPLAVVSDLQLEEI